MKLFIISMMLISGLSFTFVASAQDDVSGKLMIAAPSSDSSDTQPTQDDSGKDSGPGPTFPEN